MPPTYATAQPLYVEARTARGLCLMCQLCHVSVPHGGPARSHALWHLREGRVEQARHLAKWAPHEQWRLRPPPPDLTPRPMQAAPSHYEASQYAQEREASRLRREARLQPVFAEARTQLETALAATRPQAVTERHLLAAKLRAQVRAQARAERAEQGLLTPSVPTPEP